MKTKNNWLIKIIIPNSNQKLTIYENGLVYGSEYNKKLFILKKEAVDEIKSYINKSIYNLKRDERTIQKTVGFITKINDTSRKNRNIKVYGWEYESKIIRLITNKSNVQKLLCN